MGRRKNSTGMPARQARKIPWAGRVMVSLYGVLVYGRPLEKIMCVAKDVTMAWTRVASRSEVEEKKIADCAVGGNEIALYWVDGEIYATDNICTHAFARLSEGFLDGDCIECPVHQALFNVKTGAAVSPPAYQAVKTYPCRVEGENIMIEV